MAEPAHRREPDASLDDVAPAHGGARRGHPFSPDLFTFDAPPSDLH